MAFGFSGYFMSFNFIFYRMCRSTTCKEHFWVETINTYLQSVKCNQSVSSAEDIFTESNKIVLSITLRRKLLALGEAAKDKPSV